MDRCGSAGQKYGLGLRFCGWHGVMYTNCGRPPGCKHHYVPWINVMAPDGLFNSIQSTRLLVPSNNGCIHMHACFQPSPSCCQINSHQAAILIPSRCDSIPYRSKSTRTRTSQTSLNPSTGNLDSAAAVYAKAATGRHERSSKWETPGRVVCTT